MPEKEIPVAPIVDENPSETGTIKKMPRKKAEPKKTKAESVAALKREIAGLNQAHELARNNAETAFAQARTLERDMNELRLQYAKVVNFVGASVESCAASVKLALKGDL